MMINDRGVTGKSRGDANICTSSAGSMTVHETVEENGRRALSAP
jgi:hypothetical protein